LGMYTHSHTSREWVGSVDTLPTPGIGTLQKKRAAGFLRIIPALIGGAIFITTILGTVPRSAANDTLSRKVALPSASWPRAISAISVMTKQSLSSKTGVNVALSTLCGPSAVPGWPAALWSDPALLRPHLGTAGYRRNEVNRLLEKVGKGANVRFAAELTIGWRGHEGQVRVEPPRSVARAGRSGIGAKPSSSKHRR
jgi:hypothetical protein